MSDFDRTTGIGASDAGKALGVSRFGKRFDLYLELTHQAAPLIETAVMEWGKLLEPVILGKFSRDHDNARLTGRQKLVRHVSHEFMYVHFDALWPKGRAIIEAKTGWTWNANDWGEPGTDEIPDDYFAQAQHQLAVAGPKWERVIIPALLYRPPLREYVVTRDQAFIDEVLIPNEADLWERAQRRDPPPIEPGEGAEAYLRARFPSANGEQAEATEDDVRLGLAYMSAREQRKAAEQAMNAAKTTLAERMGALEKLIASDLVISYGNVGNSRLDQDALRRAHPDIFEEFTNRTPGRRFDVKVREV